MRLEADSELGQGLHKEPSLSSAPTRLTLFPPNGVDPYDLARQDQEAHIFQQNLVVTQDRYEALDDMAYKRVDEIAALKSEIKTLSHQYISMRTASAAYLAIYDSLSARGLSSGEVYDFFERCFQGNSAVYDSLDQENIFMEALRLRADREKRMNNFLTAKKFSGKRPEWYSGTENEWVIFFTEHADFLRLLNPGGSSRSSLEDIYRNRLGMTFSAYPPDWMIDVEEEPPSREAVQAELDEDNAEWNAVVSSESDLNRKHKDLYDYMSSQFRRRVIAIEKRRRELFSIDSLASFLIYMNATKNTYEYQGNLDEFADLNMDEIIDDHGYIPEESRNMSIHKAAERDVPMPELVALWLERKFREGGIDIAQTVDDDLLQGFIMVKGESGQDDLWSLRSKNKKLFKFLNYEISPLISAFSEEERQYFYELLDSSKGESVEFVLWELSEIISHVISRSADPEIVKKRRDLSRFSLSWLANNWEWGYEQLQVAIKGESVEQEVLPENSGLIKTEGQILEGGLPSLNSPSIDEPEVNSDEELSDKRQLEGWTFYYAPSRRVDDELVPVGGKTLADKEFALETLLYRHGNQVSIKKSSIINALTWRSLMDPGRASMLPKMEVDGQIWEKIKRGGVRIFCRVNGDDYSITFFVHQKKAMQYKF